MFKPLEYNSFPKYIPMTNFRLFLLIFPLITKTLKPLQTWTNAFAILNCKPFYNNLPIIQAFQSKQLNMPLWRYLKNTIIHRSSYIKCMGMQAKKAGRQFPTFTVPYIFRAKYYGFLNRNMQLYSILYTLQTISCHEQVHMP